MVDAPAGSSVASTSKAKPSILSSLRGANIAAQLPAKPRTNGDFKTQDDFISFADLDLDAGQQQHHVAPVAASTAGANGRSSIKAERGRKRKIDQVLDEQGLHRLTEQERRTPWTADVDWDSFPSATEQLTAEIKAFSRYIQPTDQEHDLRSAVVESIRRLIVKRWPNSQLHPFGSFMTRLYLPTGDIDLVCVIPSLGGPENKGMIRSALYQISTMLRNSNLGKDIIVIGKARVPIIKFTSVQGGFKVDISVNMTNSIKVYPRVLELFSQVGEEAARALIMVTKAFLNQRQMNEVHTGGLGSYSIICLVCSFLQMHPKLQRREIAPSDNLGTLLLEFLEVYGKNFNYDDVGICLSGRGSYYSKRRRGWQSDRGSKLTLSIEDPADPTNDVSSGSYNMHLVRQSISGAFEVLTAAVYYRTSIILARLANHHSGGRSNVATLSGRALPAASGAEGTDETRKSMLGAILGVTGQVEQSRRELRRLADSGAVQHSLGLHVNRYDEDGMLLPPGQSRTDVNGATAGSSSRPRFTNTNPNHIRFEQQQQQQQRESRVKPPEPQEAPPPPPPATSAQRGEGGGEEDMDMGTPPTPAATQQQAPPEAVPQPPAKKQKISSKTIDLTTPEPEERRSKNVKTQPAPSARTYINLDSPSPEPEAEVAKTERPEASTSRRDRRESAAEADSRYSVKKGRKATSQQQQKKEPYVPTPAGSDSSVLITSDSDSEAGMLKPKPRPVMRKSGSGSRVVQRKRADSASDSDVEVDKGKKPRTRSRTLSQSQAKGQRAVLNGKKAGQSDASSSDDGLAARPSEKGKGKAKSQDKGKGKPSKPVISAEARRAYWTAKSGTSASAPDGAGGSDSSSDDGVYVVSGSATKPPPPQAAQSKGKSKAQQKPSAKSKKQDQSS